MILAVDVQYLKSGAVAAGLQFEDWSDEAPAGEYVSVIDTVAPYEPGQFYKRELPCILALLQEHSLSPSTIVVDGYVYRRVAESRSWKISV